MKKLIGILSLSSLLASAAVAAPLTVGIVKLEAPISSNDTYSAFATNGEIYNVDQSNTELIERIKEAVAAQTEVEATLAQESEVLDLTDQRNEIVDIALLNKNVDEVLYQNMEAISSTNKDFSGSASLMSSYITDVDSQSDAASLFYTMRQDTKSKSQCFNRAHVWSWELHSKRYNGRRVQTGKIWIFFTKKYIRDYKYKWWFHIAPYVTVNGQVRVMDRSYSSQPVSEQSWTNMFISTNEKCKEVSRYTQYENSPFERNCFVMKSSVYYWQPWQLENVEKRNQNRNEWNQYELKKAYKNAIGWFSRVPTLN